MRIKAAIRFINLSPFSLKKSKSERLIHLYAWHHDLIRRRTLRTEKPADKKDVDQVFNYQIHLGDESKKQGFAAVTPCLESVIYLLVHNNLLFSHAAA